MRAFGVLFPSMQLPFSRRAWPVFLLFAALLVGAQTLEVQAVRDGTPVDGNSVFLYKDDVGPGGATTSYGTAASVKYKRCMVTAGHVHNGMGTGKKMYKGQDLRVITEETRRAAVVAGGAHADQTQNWVDFAVLWLEKRMDGELTKFIQESHYAPLEPKKAEDFGLTADVAGTIGAHLVGYGFNATVDGVDTGDKIKRLGNPNAALWALGSSQTPAQKGSMIQAVPVAADSNRIGCMGDSGAPLQKSGASGIFGVLATGNAALCKDVTLNKFSAFDDTNAQGGKTNWLRVNEMIKTTCGKMIVGDKDEMGSTGQGKVIGQLSPVHEWPPVEGDDFDSNIACGDGTPDIDCREFMHEPETMTLTAIPAVGSRFVGWVERDGQAVGYGDCPCHGSASQTCVVPYDQVGYYDTETSFDMSGCFAVFELDPVPPV